MKLFLLLFMSLAATAPGEVLRFKAKLELDAFVTNWGAEYYPRARWSAQVPYGRLTGFDFIYSDRNPGPWFTNHVLTYTPLRASWFSIRSEIGGTPAGYFAQLGPQINLQVIKGVKKPVQFLVISFLPELGGTRSHNLLVGSMSKSFSSGLLGRAYVDTYWRFFPQRGFSGTYGEAWLWFVPQTTKHFEFGLLVRDNKADWMGGLDIRFKLGNN